MRFPLPLLLVAAGSDRLPGVFQDFAGPLHDWGYLAVAGFLFLENFGVPVPGETVLIAAALYAGTGDLNIWLVAVVGWAAAVAGHQVGYVIGRTGGHDVVVRYGKAVFITPARLDRAERFYERRGGLVVFFARFVEGLRQLNGIIAGIVEMPWRRFLLFQLAGGALWVAVWTGAGYLAGDHVEAIQRSFTYVVLGATALVVLFAVFHVRRLRRHRAERRS